MELEKLELSHSDKVWLDALLLRFNRGEVPSVRKLLVELRAKLPVDFDPYMMDDRVVFTGNQITLYGMWHIDPVTQWIAIVGRIISQIKHLLFIMPDRTTFTSDEISTSLELTKEVVNMGFSLIAPLGFMRITPPDEESRTVTATVDEHLMFKKCIYFQTVEIAMQEYLLEYTERLRAPLSATPPKHGEQRVDRGAKIHPDTAYLLVRMEGLDDQAAFEASEVMGAVCGEFGLRCTRVDDIEPPGRVSDAGLRKMQESEIVVADVTSGRPELFYEIGFAHAQGKRPILVRRRGTDMPFQLTGYQVEEYDDGNGLTDILRTRLASILGVRRMFSKRQP
ncbi:MAG: hypothetical protein MUF82_05015 [Bacteroidetes bacterium]|jgi:hypothetical protein|nr:hypothetical protein [Bacteroidota bacterium]